MARFSLLSLGVGVLLAATGCASPDDDPAAEEDEAALINGAVAAPATFPATLNIVGNCTVTRIGERLLLSAAHCVRTDRGAITPAFAPRSKLAVTVRGARPGPRQLTVTRTAIHPQIARLCATRGCVGRASSEQRDAPDVAVIEVEGPLDGVAIAEIEVAPLPEGTAVTTLGYGCTDPTTPSDGKLRFRETRLVGAEASVHPGGLSGANAIGLENTRTNYGLTPGPRLVGAAPSAAGLCLGDSGGALYRTGTNRVVGVNASYTFLPASNVPVTNWHTRLDGDARWGVASWLEALGARLSRPCTATSCRPIARDR